MTDFIYDILQALEENKIDYVHWKSNTNIEDALTGKDDLDILVDPNKKEEIYTLFKKYNIIKGYSKKDLWQKEIYHYFGIDINKKKLVHIHLHFLLEVGYDADKSVNLPIIKKYLYQKHKYKYIYIPRVENEYILLVVRLILKNALVPYLLMSPKTQIRLWRNQKSGIVFGGAYEEFQDLRGRVDRQQLQVALTEIFPFLSQQCFYQCEKTIIENNSLKEYFISGKELKKEIKPYIYHTELKAFALSFWRVNSERVGRLFKKSSKKIPEHGGRIFAFVGGDGAGKTSNIQALKKVLSEHFKVSVVHIGRPKLGLLSYGLLIFSKGLKVFGFSSMSKAFVYLAIAYGRKKAFTKAKKSRDRGEIVLLDRIPLDGITSMDCPRIETLANKKVKLLSRIEKNLYATIKGTDRLIVLKVNPKVALTRRPEDDPNELLIRSGQIWNKDFSNVDNAYIVSTENTFDFVEQKILNIVWESLNEI